MTDLTPQQMRELADDNLRIGTWHGRATAALYAAADQLEVVPEQLHDILNHIEMPEEVYVSLHAWYQRLTADTAPQEDRDD